MTLQIIGICCAISANLIWGTTFPGNKYLFQQGVDTFLLAFLRLVIAIVCLFPFYLHTRRTTHWSRRNWIQVLLIGIFLAGGGIALEYTGTKYTKASNVSVIVSTDCIVTTLLSVLILKEKIQKSTMIGGLCALLGVILLISEDIRKFELHAGLALYGDLLVMACVFCWSCYTVVMKPIIEYFPPFYTLFFTSLFSCIPMGIISAANGSWYHIADITPCSWGVIFYLGIFGSFVAYLLYFQALKILPVSILALSLVLLPVVGVAISVRILREPLTLVSLTGIVVILIGLTYAMWPRRAKMELA